MKRFFLFILILTAFVSCGSEDKCTDVKCSEWQSCNADNGMCELTAGRCSRNRDCTDNKICDETKTCVDKCKDVICSEWESCNIDNGMCDLKAGRCLTNDDCTENKICGENKICVIESCTENDTKEISCGLNNNGIQNQKCVDKVWINQGTCVDSDICKNGQKKPGTTSCGSIGNFYQQICENGQWTESDICINPTYFITTWKTDEEGFSSPTQIIIPINPDYTYNYKVDCNNDGIWEAENVTDSYTCNYDVAGIYQIAITGTFPAIYNYFEEGITTDRKKLISVDQWGTISWKSMAYAFCSCYQLEVKAFDTPDLSNVTNMSHMFDCAISFNQDINSWDVSNITDMSFMFSGTLSFNQDISSWDVSKVIFMNGMFLFTPKFNQPLNSWNVKNVIDMRGMFYDATSFNQDLSSWNVLNVTQCEKFSGFSMYTPAWTLPKPNFTQCNPE